MCVFTWPTRALPRGAELLLDTTLDELTTDPGLGPEEIEALGAPALDAETFMELIKGPDRDPGLDVAIDELGENTR